MFGSTTLSPSRHRKQVVTLVLCCCALVQPAVAQTDAFGDADPVKLFEQGQNAHARAEAATKAEDKTEQYNLALEFYDEAIKVKPEFPEAEFQRANALTSLGRLADAEAGLKRAIQLRKDWALPYAALGALLVRLDRDKEAESALRQALLIDPHNASVLQQLGGLLSKRNDLSAALLVAKQATAEPDAGAAAWFIRALAERGTGDSQAAVASLTRVLEIDPRNLQALIERAEIRIALNAREAAIDDLKNAEGASSISKNDLGRIAAAYATAGLHNDAERVARLAGIPANVPKSGGVVGTAEEIEAANSDDPTKARAALEALLKKNPRSASLLAQLGASYRTEDPSRSLDYYRRALDLEPANAEFATGYGSALVRARRFADAVTILRQVIRAVPGNYAAHANLATALYELKQFADSLVEYEWLLAAKPDLVVTHYFIATARDNLGQYKDALAAYELFLSQANPEQYQLEIGKVKLRLPSLRRQIQRGEGVKNKSAGNGKP
ncbi:MAG TPA: tetratricopeptide repeat protein [Pyrinomonadaceae bacterium]|nr:tetratricopeptide repeat protein [Pyrinomonadaceae bacterium]